MKITAEKQAAKTMREGIVYPPFDRRVYAWFRLRGRCPRGLSGFGR
jgi:hypothetical protein